MFNIPCVSYKKDKQYTKYKTSLNESNKANRRCKLNFFNTVNATMKNAEIFAKKKFSILTKLMKSQKVSSVPHLKEGDNIISNYQEKCNIFNEFFSSKATVTGADDPVPILQVNKNKGTPLNNINTSYIEVAKFCRDVKKSYSSHCGIPGKFISMIATPLSFPLTQEFNNMFSAGIFPDIFKIAHICCINKRSGVKSDKSNWGPISLLPTLSKVAESVMHRQLLSHFTEHSVISNRQAAYMKGDSTVQQLLYIVHIIRTTWTHKKIMQGVFLDVSAAFYKAWHPAIIAKLEHVKVGGSFLELFKSYLSNRQQIVTIDGYKSTSRIIMAGVPQGSRLGPLLWILYANDILDELECEVLLFADDTCMFASGNDPAETSAMLNRDLLRISSWATRWKVSFNPGKTKQMIFSNKVLSNSPAILINSIVVKQVYEHKHLGIWLTPTLCWSRHI